MWSSHNSFYASLQNLKHIISTLKCFLMLFYEFETKHFHEIHFLTVWICQLELETTSSSVLAISESFTKEHSWAEETRVREYRQDALWWHISDRSVNLHGVQDLSLQSSGRAARSIDEEPTGLFFLHSAKSPKCFHFSGLLVIENNGRFPGPTVCPGRLPSLFPSLGPSQLHLPPPLYIFISTEKNSSLGFFSSGKWSFSTTTCPTLWQICFIVV